MKILVYGAGVLGSLYAARFQESGQEVSILSRGQRLNDIQEYGIVLEDFRTGQRTTTPVKTVNRLDPEDAYDLIVVILPKDSVSEVLPTLASNHNTSNILFLGNNAAGSNEITSALGSERVLLGFPNAAGTRKGNVVYYVDSSEEGKSSVTIGELNGAITPRLKKIIEVFDLPADPPKGIRKSAMNRPRGQLNKLSTWMVDALYSAALELETHRDEQEMQKDADLGINHS